MGRSPQILTVGFVLKSALFATGFAGLVAEFVLSTLATYLIGNAIIQWTLVMSLMLFAMGLGSRLSRVLRHHLLDTFIWVEFGLSLLCALSAQLTYGVSAYTSYQGLLIYSLATVIGMLIGLEIPLVIRLNQEYEELRVNIANVMEKDYYGALIGGLVFAFFLLPRLGLTYTPIALGAINFSVASLLFWRFFRLVYRRRLLTIGFASGLSALVVLGLFAKPVMRYGEQRQFKDKVIYSVQTPYQQIVITQWKNDYWLFINGQEQFSTYDEEKYHEPLVHPALSISADAAHTLILGGGDGLALRETLKHAHVDQVTLVDLDPAMTRLAREHPVMLQINQGSLNDSRVRIINDDAAKFLQTTRQRYGAIIVDLPDPDSIDLMQVYSVNFYRLIRRHLIRGGVMVTQATSPFFSKDAFLCIIKTMQAAGFTVLPYHNHIPTMGEWGWALGVDKELMDAQRLKRIAQQKAYTGIKTSFLNNDAMLSMLHFGKGVLEDLDSDRIQVNSEINPVLFQYYSRGSWGVY